MVSCGITKPLFLLLLLLTVPVVYTFLKKGVRKPGGRRIASLIIRIMVITLLAFSLSGVSVDREGGRVNVIFLLDRSDSLDDISRSLALKTIQKVMSFMDENDTAGLVVFGRNASVEIPPKNKLEILEIESDVDGSATNIYNALQVAIGAFPEAGENRIVLLSDGNENRGRVLDIIGIARSSGLPIFTVPIRSAFVGNEISVRDILAPSEVRRDQTHEFNVIVHSLEEAAARLTLFKDGRYIGEEPIRLKEGENSFAFTSSFDTSGLHRYEVIVNSETDTLLENNRFETFVRVAGPPSILYISKEGEESQSLIQALEMQGIQTVAGRSIDIPIRLSDLIRYDAVILDNVPGFDISLAKMDLLELYVRDNGGGLIMLGGESSFGVGGYYKTPVENVLPVDVDAPLPVSIPSLSLIMLIDKSGSMASSVEGGSIKLDLAKEAAFEAVKLLNPLHRVGLLAFDADFEWIVPLTEAGERDRITKDLFRLSTGGGTDLYTAYEEGVRKLAETPSAIKHIIILSDGLTTTGDFKTLTKYAAEKKITVSTVAVGEDADRRLMEDIADQGGGRSYFTDDIRQVPRIFASETMIVSRGLISEETFFPGITSPSEILRGFDPADFPPLEGFVRTYLKSGAQQVLGAVGNIPLLAVRRYGLGRSAAFTSDLNGRWSGEWLKWEAFPRFSAQLVRWTQRPESAKILYTNLSRKEGKGIVKVDAVDADRNYLNLLNLKAVVLLPGLSTEEIELEQIAPGRYSGAFTAEETGQYFITLYGSGDDFPIPPESFGLIVPYPEEYTTLDPDISLLNNLASRTGGRMTLFDDPEEAADLFRGESGDIVIVKELWPFLALAALLLFILEIAVRKLVLSPALRDRLLNGLRRIGSRERSKSVSYEEWEETIRDGRRQKEEERDREGIIPMFKRDRLKVERMNRVYMAGLRKREKFTRQAHTTGLHTTRRESRQEPHRG
jgi:uncharacterized membrane protein/secreted protein with Ig-like and vWFA domain